MKFVVIIIIIIIIICVVLNSENTVHLKVRCR